MGTQTVDLIQSGEDDDVLWVSLHFKSHISGDDVIHVVCAQSDDDQDRRLGMDQIYLERDDQARSGYGGADAIVVSEEAVHVALNERGCSNLELPKALRFDWAQCPEGRAQAIAIFTRMTSRASGAVVHVA